MILPAWKGFDQAFVDPLDELEALACIAKARARESQRESKKARESERQTDRQTEAQRQRDTETAHAQSSRLSSHGRKSPTRLQRTHVDCLSEQSTLDKPSALSSAQACLFLGSREQPGRGSTAQCSAFLQW